MTSFLLPCAPAPLWRRSSTAVCEARAAADHFFASASTCFVHALDDAAGHGIPFTNFFTATSPPVGRQGGAGGRQPALHAPRHGAPLISRSVQSAIYWLSCSCSARRGLFHFCGTAVLPPSRLPRRAIPWPRFLAIQIWLMVLFSST